MSLLMINNVQHSSPLPGDQSFSGSVDDGIQADPAQAQGDDSRVHPQVIGHDPAVHDVVTDAPGRGEVLGEEQDRQADSDRDPQGRYDFR